jgi:Membrane protein involved in the export of O-antigen and teichoic acid
MAFRQPGVSSLSANFTWTLVGNGIYSGGQWAVLVLLAKMTSPEVVGQYALGLAIVLPVLMFTNLQLRWIVTADVGEQRHFGDYLSFRLASTAFALLVIFAIVLLFGYKAQLGAVILLAGLAQAIEAVSDVYHARLQLWDRMDRISKSMMMRTALSVLGLGIAVYVTRSLVFGLLAVVLARMAVLLGYDMRRGTHDLRYEKGGGTNRALRPRWQVEVQRELLWLSLPLGLIAVLVSLNSSIPRYFIEHALGERALGIFSAIVFLYSAGTMAVVSLGQSAFTRLAKLYAEEDLTGFRLLLAKLLTMGTILGVCGLLVVEAAGRPILTILFRPEYADYADLLPWVMGAACITYLAQFLGFGMTAAKSYTPQVYLFLLTNLCAGLASGWLIPRLGLLGAVLALFLSAVVQLIGSAVILQREIRKRVEVNAGDAAPA